MNRRSFFAHLEIAPAAAAPAAGLEPNLVLILGDDLGWYGNRQIHTPAIVADLTARLDPWERSVTPNRKSSKVSWASLLVVKNVAASNRS
jgi:hypothetical protein